MKEQIKEILREVFEFGRESNHGEPHYDRTADQILALTDEKVKAERDKWVKAIDISIGYCEIAKDAEQNPIGKQFYDGELTAFKALKAELNK